MNIHLYANKCLTDKLDDPFTWSMTKPQTLEEYYLYLILIMEASHGRVTCLLLLLSIIQGKFLQFVSKWKVYNQWMLATWRISQFLIRLLFNVFCLIRAYYFWQWDNRMTHDEVYVIYMDFDQSDIWLFQWLHSSARKRWQTFIRLLLLGSCVHAIFQLPILISYTALNKVLRILY